MTKEQFLDNVNYYPYFSKGENREEIKARLATIWDMGLSELGNGQFGIKDVMSGLYIEMIWRYSNKEFAEYIEWVQSIIDKNTYKPDAVPSVITGNKIIAKYLGYEYVPHNNTEGKKAGWWKIGTTREQQVIAGMAHDTVITLGRSHNDLKFYHDWNALMDAIEVIEKDGETDKEYGNHVDVTTSYCRVGNISIDRKIAYPHLNKQQAAWLAVVRYCKQKNDLRDKAAENQCDGCKAGYPIGLNNMHLMPYPSGSMVCQKDKYELDFKVEWDGSKTYGFIKMPDQEKE
jgi:hypothetical protein